MPTLPDYLRKTLVKWVSKTNVSHKATLKESERSDAFTAINDLIWNDKVSWLDFLLQTAHSTEGNNCPYTNLFQNCDVGPCWDFMRRKFVVKTMAREESDWDWLAGTW